MEQFFLLYEVVGFVAATHAFDDSIGEDIVLAQLVVEVGKNNDEFT